MDIPKRDATVCIRVQDSAKAATNVPTLSSLSSHSLELDDHLRRPQVTLVVIEATGDYWKPFYFLLTEQG